MLVNLSPISYPLIQINWLNLMPTNGMFYVEGGFYTESVTVNGTSGFGNLSNLKGIVGVDGLASTTINGIVTITNTLTGFTLNGFTINGRLIIDTNTGTLNLENLDVNYTALLTTRSMCTTKMVRSTSNR